MTHCVRNVNLKLELTIDESKDIELVKWLDTFDYTAHPYIIKQGLLTLKQKNFTLGSKVFTGFKVQEEERVCVNEISERVALAIKEVETAEASVDATRKRLEEKIGRGM